MRFKVEYTYGAGSYGNREFDLADNADESAIEFAAKSICPPSVRILKVEPLEVA